MALDQVRPKNVRAPGTPCAYVPGDGKISELIEWTDVVGGTGTVVIGTIPAGATFLGCRVWVITAFNAGANNALIVGIPTDTNYFIENGRPTDADTEVNEVTLIDYTPTSDVIVSAIYTHTSTVPTAGKAQITVYYERPL